MPEIYCEYRIYGPEDREVTLIGGEFGAYNVKIGRDNYVTIHGDLESLAQVSATMEALVENERIRKAMPVGFEEEKKRAEGT